MRDITLEDTFRHPFSTRAFGTGIPTVLAGTPVLSVLEENNATPITAGVSVSVDRASVVGLNEVTIVATAANGYENGKSYGIYISTGTVGGVSVIGEVVGHFTIGLSAAAVDLANATDGLTALAADIATVDGTVNNINSGVAIIIEDTNELQTDDVPGLIAALNDIAAADVLAAGDVDGFTLEESLKLILSAVAAKLSGAATVTVIIRAADDTKDRITATVDASGNRSAVTLDAVG